MFSCAVKDRQYSINLQKKNGKVGKLVLITNLMHNFFIL
jgi:hypothetical protein